MKKLLVLLAVLILTVMTALPASADIIFEPDDLFYQRHRDECSYVGRNYIANGREGYASLHSAPGSVAMEHVLNGEQIHISHVWTDKGERQWGVTQDGRWIELSELALIYGWQEFEAEFKSDFRGYDGTGDDLSSVCLYSYPGGVFRFVLEEHEEYMPFDEAFTYIYTDENGLRWSFVGYYMGRQNGWACLDDPDNEALGIKEELTVGQVWNGEDPIAQSDPTVPVEAELYPPAEKLPVAAKGALWIIPAALVIVVVVVTALLVRKRRK